LLRWRSIAALAFFAALVLFAALPLFAALALWCERSALGWPRECPTNGVLKRCQQREIPIDIKYNILITEFLCQTYLPKKNFQKK